jgi:hypothetical protein
MKGSYVKKLTLIVSTIIMIITLIIAFQGNGIFARSMPTINSYENAGNEAAANSISKVIGAVLYITKIIAVGVALIMLAVLAIKYMSSAPGDRATIKKHAVVYIVGAIVLFGAAGILNIIQQFSTNFN